MASRFSVGSPHQPDPLDIPLRALTVRTLTPRRLSAIDRVRGEFVEMRGFSPTVEQAARLFDLAGDACREILTALVREGFLTHTSDGRYRLQA
jgi:DNA-binding IclR family transcriptional regulator